MANSRQREYQKNNIAKGLCALCPRPQFKWKRCRKHYKRALEDYEKMRAKKNRTRRNGKATLKPSPSVQPQPQSGSA
jgi:hypothetical protein